MQAKNGTFSQGNHAQNSKQNGMTQGNEVVATINANISHVIFPLFRHPIKLIVDPVTCQVLTLYVLGPITVPFGVKA